MRRPCQAPYQVAGRLRREGEPHGLWRDARDGRGGEEEVGREYPEIQVASGVDDRRAPGRGC